MLTVSGAEPPLVKNTPVFTINGSPGTTAVVSLPTNVAGDLLIVNTNFWFGDNPPVATPSGWTALGGTLSSTGSEVQSFYRVSPGGLTSVSFSNPPNSALAAVAVCFPAGSFGAVSCVGVALSADPAPISMSGPFTCIAIVNFVTSNVTAYPLPNNQSQNSGLGICTGPANDSINPGSFTPTSMTLGGSQTIAVGAP